MISNTSNTPLETLQAMAASKPSDVSASCSSSILFKTFEIAMRKSERHLLLSTTYGLNSSWSKKITVGLALRLDGTFTPVVRLTNNYASGVALTAYGWELLRERFNQIDNYFGSENSSGGMLSELRASETVSLAGCSLRFTTAHKAKSIAFYETPYDAFTVEDSQPVDLIYALEDEAGAEGPAAKKQKKKNWEPVIVMQKTTFDGLKHLASCIDEHIAKLELLKREINLYKAGMVTFFSSVLKTRKMSSPTLQQIGVVVCEEAENAKDVVVVQCSENFRDNYSNIIFYELTGLFLAYIIADIRQSVLTA